MKKWTDLFKNLLEEDLFSNFEERDFPNMEKETLSFTKGNFKTDVSLFFNEKGYLAGWSSKCTLLPKEPEGEEKIKLLEEEKRKAIENEDFQLAAELRDQLKQLKNA